MEKVTAFYKWAVVQNTVQSGNELALWKFQLDCEKGFGRIKGYLDTAEVTATIKQLQEEECELQKAV